MHLSEASTRYLAVRQQDGYSPYTLTAYQFQHQALIHDVGDPDVSTLTLDDLRTHLAHYGHLQPPSLGHKIRAIKSLFRWLEDPKGSPPCAPAHFSHHFAQPRRTPRCRAIHSRP